MTENRLTVQTADSGHLDVLVAGPGDGLPLVYHHGTPGGLVPMRPLITAAAAHGLRTVMYSRPGYGGSTPKPGRAVADAADDVQAVLDALGVAQFVTAGWSGGGPHALACGALLPGRCLAVASVAGIAPFDADGLAWPDGMGPENIEEFAAAERGEAELTAFLEKEAQGLAGARADDVAQALGGLVSAADKAVLTDEFAGFLAESFHAALSHGITGWRDDDFAFMKDWGFALDDAGAVAIWQGGQDRMVPYAHGAWLAGRIPHARAHLLPAAGHLGFAATGWDEILTDLAELAGLAGRRGA